MKNVFFSQEKIAKFVVDVVDRVTVALNHRRLMGWSLLVEILLIELLNDIVVLKKCFSTTLPLTNHAVETQQTALNSIFIFEVQLARGINDADQIVL